MIFSSQLGKLEGYTEQEAIKNISNHIRKMQEELEYRLSVLDSSNISEIDAETTNILTEDGNLLNVLDDQAGNYSRLEQNMSGLQVEVRNNAGSISTLTQTATGLQSSIQTLDGNYSSLSQTVSGLQSTVSSQGSSITQLTQTDSSLQASVSDLQTGLATTLKMDASGLYIVDQSGKQISFSGGQIRAASITANQIAGNTITAAEIAANSITGSCIDADTLYVNAANITGTLKAGALYGSTVGLYNGEYLAGSFTLSGDSTGLGVLLESNSGIQIQASGNTWIYGGGGGSLALINSGVTIGGVLRVNTDCYGSSLPSGAQSGQVFFLLD